MAEKIKRRTGQDAPRTGTYRSASSGTEIQVEAGNHLPPDPSSREATEWEFIR